MLLFDEIEKAHPDIFNILLQILDDGRLTDAQGRTVDFKHTVVIMTSNIGADRIQEQARTGESFDQLKDDLMQILRGSFRPEFINRIDEIIVFHALVGGAAARHHAAAARPARRGGCTRSGSTSSSPTRPSRFLAQEGYDPEYGARPLRRTITRLVENELSRLVLGGDVEPGDRVTVEVEDGKLRFDIEKGVVERATEDEKVGAGVGE